MTEIAHIFLDVIILDIITIALSHLSMREEFAVISVYKFV